MYAYAEDGSEGNTFDGFARKSQMLRATADSPLSFSQSQPDDSAAVTGDAGNIAAAAVGGGSKKRGGYKEDTVSAALKRRAPNRLGTVR